MIATRGRPRSYHIIRKKRRLIGCLPIAELQKAPSAGARLGLGSRQAWGLGVPVAVEDALASGGIPTVMTSTLSRFGL